MRALALLLCLASCAAPQYPEEPPAEEIGSLRHARVALARAGERPPLTYFARRLDPAQQEELRALAPGLNLVAGLSQAEAEARAGEAHGADASYATAAFLRAAERLVWLQAHGAGVESYLDDPALRDSERIILTNYRGVHGPAIAEHAFALLLALTRDLEQRIGDARAGRWQRDHELEPVVLEGRTLLVVGLGGIGSAIARRGHGFGMRVLAVRRSGEPAPEYVTRVGGPRELLALLPEADVVAIALPLTAETEGLFGAAALAAMKPGSYLINIARGRIVDTDALLAALQSGRLAGAALDVTDPEPLPPEHPLWRQRNVLITPHVAAAGALTEARGWALWRENLRRFDAGEPLLNVVDKQAGY